MHLGQVVDLHERLVQHTHTHTLFGMIVVNKVVVCAHSSWVLDKYLAVAFTKYHMFGPSAADILDMNSRSHFQATLLPIGP